MITLTIIAAWVALAILAAAVHHAVRLRDPIQPMDAPTCPKCDNPGQPPHPCPFAHDVHNDAETLCSCCDDCEDECARDI